MRVIQSYFEIYILIFTHKLHLNASPIYIINITVKNTISEALPGVLGNRGTRAFISREQGNKCLILRGSGEQRQYLGLGEHREQIFDFWGTGEQAILFQGNKGTGTPPPPLGGPHLCLKLKRISQRKAFQQFLCSYTFWTL